MKDIEINGIKETIVERSDYPIERCKKILDNDDEKDIYDDIFDEEIYKASDDYKKKMDEKKKEEEQKRKEEEERIEEEKRREEEKIKKIDQIRMEIEQKKKELELLDTQ